MQVIKADEYQGWVIKTKDEFIAVDPWLTDHQKFPSSGFLLNRASESKHFLNHSNNIQHVTHLIITAHFSDHLDKASLEKFDRSIPIFTTHIAKKILVKIGFKDITVVEPDSSYTLKHSQIHVLKSGKPYQSTSFSYVLQHDEGSIFHEGHIFNQKLIESLNQYKLDLLILTGDLVKVFGMIKVSMEVSDALKIKKNISAKYLAITGNYPNKFGGLIAKFLYYKQSTTDQPLVCRKALQSLII
jgi:L-ascorbate metabolism protein UlaG (beta-lactamase superfamily)